MFYTSHSFYLLGGVIEESACDVVAVISLLPQTKQTSINISSSIFWKRHQDGQIGEKGV